MPTNPEYKSDNPYLTSNLLHCGREHEEYYPSEMDFHCYIPEFVVCCVTANYVPFSEMKYLYMKQKGQL